MKDKELREKFESHIENRHLRDDLYLKNTVEKINEEFGKKQDKLDLVECEKCGCLLKKETAIRGKSEVKERYTTATAIYYKMPPEEYIHEVYFCRRCGKK